MDEQGSDPQESQLSEIPRKRIQRKPTAFEKRVEARALDQVTKALDERLDPGELTDTDAKPPAEDASVSGPESAPPESPFAQALRLLQSAKVGSSPKALRLLADLAELVQGGEPAPVARASHVIQPSGGGLPVCRTCAPSTSGAWAPCAPVTWRG